MAFDFGAFLSGIGQVAPAMSEGAEIRRQRAADAATVSQQAQAAADTHQARLAQTERERALTQQQNRLIPLSDKPSRGEDGKYYMLFADPRTGMPQRLPVEGNYDPLIEKRQTLKSLGIPEDSDLGRQYLLGVKPTTATPVLRQNEQGDYEWIEKPGGRMPSALPSNPNAPAGPGVIPTGVKGRLPASATGSETDTDRTDPVTGLTTHSHSIRRPLGAPGTGPTPTPVRGGGSSPSGGGSPYALDANGQIPARPGLNENVRAAANSLLTNPIASDQDIEAKLRPMARSLAMKYGWQPHVKLSTTERGAIQTDEQLIGFSNEVLPKIEQAGLKDANGPNDSVRGLQAWAEYKAGRIPSDPFYASIMPSVAAIGIAGAGPWVRIGRNKYTFEVIQTHLPQPWQTPARIYANTKWLHDNVIPSSEKSIMGRLMPDTAQSVVNNMAGKVTANPADQYEQLQSNGQVTVGLKGGKWYDTSTGKEYKP